jgi:hypothetical protein
MEALSGDKKIPFESADFIKNENNGCAFCNYGKEFTWLKKLY